jgi:excisionase family DNA binding protein
MSNEDIKQRNAAEMAAAIARRALSRSEAAQALGISTFTLDRRIKDGTIHAVKFGRTIRVPVEAIDKLLAGIAHDDPVDSWVDRVLATAPPLTDEQRTRLAELLRPVRKAGGEGAA